MIEAHRLCVSLNSRLESDKVKRSVTRRGASTLEAVIISAKTTMDGVKSLGDHIFVRPHTEDRGRKYLLDV